NQLRVNDAAQMAPGSYSVRIQTEDSGGATFATVFVITVVDDITPTVISVSVPANGTYTAGQTLNFAVQFNEDISVNTVGGTPRIALTIGTATRYANYFSGSETDALTFSYTVVAGDLDTDGITVGLLGLNGSAILDAGGNNANLSLNSVGSTIGVLVDAVPPAVPTNLSATAGNTLVDLQWDANTEPDLDSYSINMLTNNNGQISVVATMF